MRNVVNELISIFHRLGNIKLSSLKDFFDSAPNVGHMHSPDIVQY